jgi:hypothetical protein
MLGYLTTSTMDQTALMRITMITNMAITDMIRDLQWKKEQSR